MGRRKKEPRAVHRENIASAASVTVDGSVIVDATAAIVGDVSAAAIQVNSGADIEGKCTIGRKDESKISEVFQTAG